MNVLYDPSKDLSNVIVRFSQCHLKMYLKFTMGLSRLLKLNRQFIITTKMLKISDKPVKLSINNSVRWQSFLIAHSNSQSVLGMSEVGAR